MAGGLISALILAFIIEKGDLYNVLAAESYQELSEQDAFWDSMSEEEQIQFKQAMAELNGEDVDTANSGSTAMTSSQQSSENTATKESTPDKKAVKAADDMFSDYGN